MKLIVKRNDLDLDIDIETLVKENFLFKNTTRSEIEKVVDDIISSLDDEYYYNITDDQVNSIYEEVENYIKTMEDYTLEEVVKSIIKSNDDLYIDTPGWCSVDIMPLLKYLIEKKEKGDK